MTGFATRAIHAGQPPDPATGSVVTPIHATSTYAQDDVGQTRHGYDYSRADNPTRSALETCLAELEGGRYARAFASGMAATDALLRATCRPGDHIVLPDDVYGGTYRLVDHVLADWGVTYTTVPISEPAALSAAIRPETRLVWCETPTNPLLSIADIAPLAQVARDGGARLVVDNTFASSYLQTPLGLGADAVVHSSTKYLAGHSDVVGGALVTDDPALAEQVAFLQKTAGAVPGPFDAWLTLRGIKTLPVRMERHCDNAERIVAMLESAPPVAAIHYPGLSRHPGHEVAAKQMRRFGGMISVRLSDPEAAAAMCRRTQVFTLAESLGGVESLIEHPGRMTHASTAGSQLQVPDDLVRLSVGIEDVEDLIADLVQAVR